MQQYDKLCKKYLNLLLTRMCDIESIDCTDDMKNTHCIDQLIRIETCGLPGEKIGIVTLKPTYNICSDIVSSQLKKIQNISSGSYGYTFEANLGKRGIVRVKMLRVDQVDSTDQLIVLYYNHLREAYFGMEYINPLLETIPNFVRTHGIWICNGGKDYTEKRCLVHQGATGKYLIKNIFNITENVKDCVTFQYAFEWIGKNKPNLIYTLDSQQDRKLNTREPLLYELENLYKNNPAGMFRIVNKKKVPYTYEDYKTGFKSDAVKTIAAIDPNFRFRPSARVFITSFIQVCVAMGFFTEKTGLNHSDFHLGNILLAKDASQKPYNVSVWGKNMIVKPLDGYVAKIIDYAKLNDGFQETQALQIDGDLRDYERFLDDLFLYTNGIVIYSHYFWMHAVVKIMALRRYDDWGQVLEEFMGWIRDLGMDDILRQAIAIN